MRKTDPAPELPDPPYPSVVQLSSRLDLPDIDRFLGSEAFGSAGGPVDVFRKAQGKFWQCAARAWEQRELR